MTLNSLYGLPTPEGGHFEAVLSMQETIRHAIQQKRRESFENALRVLDYGSGRYGLGRSLLSVETSKSDSIELYDPATEIQPSLDRNISIVKEEMVFDERILPYDVINISYVLCLLEKEQSLQMLIKLRESHPRALFTIFDYILKGRSKFEVLNILNCAEEIRWIKKLGEEYFYETHTRFTSESLQELISDAGLHVQHIRKLDPYGVRAGVIAAAQTEGNNSSMPERIAVA